MGQRQSSQHAERPPPRSKLSNNACDFSFEAMTEVFPSLRPGGGSAQQQASLQQEGCSGARPRSVRVEAGPGLRRRYHRHLQGRQLGAVYPAYVRACWRHTDHTLCWRVMARGVPVPPFDAGELETLNYSVFCNTDGSEEKGKLMGQAVLTSKVSRLPRPLGSTHLGVCGALVLVGPVGGVCWGCIGGLGVTCPWMVWVRSSYPMPAAAGVRGQWAHG